MNLPAFISAEADSPAGVDGTTEDALAMDESAFRSVYEQTATALLRYLLAVTRGREVAEDLLQETYCRFLTARLPRMDEKQTRGYLFQIATNLMRDRRRGLREDFPLEEAAEPSSPAPQFDRRLGVRQAFYRMKPRERQLLWLAYVEGSDHKEIADCTGLRAGSIRLLLFRARRKMADLIGHTLPAMRREKESEASE